MNIFGLMIADLGNADVFGELPAKKHREHRGNAPELPVL